MPYFFETVETIAPGLGFSHFDGVHLCWLGLALAAVIFNIFLYRRLALRGRKVWRWAITALLLLDEVFKFSVLFAANRFNFTYLPLHLCSINVFVILLHCIRPNKTIGNFLYLVCIPGALAALLFPSWTALPPTSAMHIHSSTAHILLLLYPIVLACAGELDISIRYLPKSMLILVCMAAVIYLVNLLLDTNFMFLMFAAENNPLYWFQVNWGNHLLGFPVIIAGVIIVMYLPVILFKNKKVPG